AFYFHAFRADDVAIEQYQKVADEYLRNLESFESGFGKLANDFNSLATHSKAQADTEIKSGGTCGDGSAPNNGPRTRGRLMDADAAGKWNGAFGQLSKDVGAASTQLRSAVQTYDVRNPAASESTLTTVSQRVRGLSDQGKALLADAKGYLGGRLQNGHYTIVENATKYPCSDFRLEQIAATVLGNAVQDFPAVPDFFNPNSPAEVTEKALTMM